MELEREHNLLLIKIYVAFDGEIEHNLLLTKINVAFDGAFIKISHFLQKKGALSFIFYQSRLEIGPLAAFPKLFKPCHPLEADLYPKLKSLQFVWNRYSCFIGHTVCTINY